jgi:hypothetical protein
MTNEEPTTIDDVAEAIGGTHAAERRKALLRVDAPISPCAWWFDLAAEELGHTLSDSERQDLERLVNEDLTKRSAT